MIDVGAYEKKFIEVACKKCGWREFSGRNAKKANVCPDCLSVGSLHQREIKAKALEELVGMGKSEYVLLDFKNGLETKLDQYLEVLAPLGEKDRNEYYAHIEHIIGAIEVQLKVLDGAIMGAKGIAKKFA